MQAVGNVLSGIGGLGILVCFILVVIKMFQHGQTGLGIATIVLAFCGIGFLVAFIYGWVRAREWNLTNIMLIWTGAIIVYIVGGIMAPFDIQQFRQQIGR
jgi:hypothetical protein